MCAYGAIHSSTRLHATRTDGLAHMRERHVSHRFHRPAKVAGRAAQVDMAAPPKLGGDGRFWSAGAVDFFQTINEQLGLIKPLSTDYLLHQTALVLLAVIDEYQVPCMGVLWRGGGGLRLASPCS